MTEHHQIGEKGPSLPEDDCAKCWEPRLVWTARGWERRHKSPRHAKKCEHECHDADAAVEVFEEIAAEVPEITEADHAPAVAAAIESPASLQRVEDMGGRYAHPYPALPGTEPSFGLGHYPPPAEEPPVTAERPFDMS